MGLNNEFIEYQKRMRALDMYILFSEVCGAFPSCCPSTLREHLREQAEQGFWQVDSLICWIV